jgi:hypothetical protein
VETHNQTDHILIGKRQQSILTDVRSLKTAYSDTDLYLSVSKQTAQTFGMERVNHEKELNDVDVKLQYRVKTSNTFTAFGNMDDDDDDDDDDDVDINRS